MYLPIENMKDQVISSEKVILKFISPFYKKIAKQNHGFSLMELIVTIVLMGITVPAILSIVGQFSVYHVKHRTATQFASMANSKIEEIIAFKNTDTNWADSISDYAISEDLGDGYTRTVTITLISNWITKIAKDGYQVEVKIHNAILSSEYTQTVVFAVK